jgi:hypothetical protein
MIVAAAGLFTVIFYSVFVFMHSASLHVEPATKAYETFELPLL